MKLMSFEVGEPVGINGCTYRVKNISYPMDMCIVEFHRPTDGSSLWLGGGKLWDLRLRNKLPSFRMKKMESLQRYRRAA